ncbi:MAG: phosphatase PAP2 family protein, partial [Clostridia bacterium]|nr:phosphatase PAP2 family protein [Clostridia bacterium]
YLSRKQCQSKKKRGWLTALSVLLFVLAFFYFCNTLFLVNESAFSVHWAIAYSVGIAVLAGAAFLGYWLSKNSDNPELLKKVLFLTAVSLVTMVIIMSTKEIMDRPRFRWVMQTGNPEYFRNWWQSGSALKASQGANVVSDDFSSFPSGHSAYAMFAIFLFPAFADYAKNCKKHRALLFVGGCLWWVLTALSRLTVGAHYVTDVCIAGLITIAAYAIVALLFRCFQKKKDNFV